jgi:1-acyl-sn-glycerol-3-phosphate acyltransferase
MKRTPRPDGQESRAVYGITRLCARIVLAVVARVRLEGAEHIPREGPVILAMNHIHWTDIPIAALAVPRVAHFMAKIELFQIPVLGGFIRLLGAFPVRRGEGDREALRTAERLLGEGKVVVIFPEGHRSDDGKLQIAHPGASYLALRTHVRVVPVGISGTTRVFKGLRLGPFAPRVAVRYGAPFYIEQGAGQRSRDALGEGTDQIMRRIAGLVPPEQRGPYEGREIEGGADPARLAKGAKREDEPGETGKMPAM